MPEGEEEPKGPSRSFLSRLPGGRWFLLVLLVALLSAMIILAALQIVLRNFFEAGIVWIDPLLRVGVLWLGLVGATVATRHNKHIRIDLLSKAFKRNTHRLIQAIIGQISGWTCLVIGTWRLLYSRRARPSIVLNYWPRCCRPSGLCRNSPALPQRS